MTHNESLWRHKCQKLKFSSFKNFRFLCVLECTGNQVIVCSLFFLILGEVNWLGLFNSSNSFRFLAIRNWSCHSCPGGNLTLCLHIDFKVTTQVFIVGDSTFSFWIGLCFKKTHRVIASNIRFQSKNMLSFTIVHLKSNWKGGCCFPRVLQLKSALAV